MKAFPYGNYRRCHVLEKKISLLLVLLLPRLVLVLVLFAAGHPRLARFRLARAPGPLRGCGVTRTAQGTLAGPSRKVLHVRSTGCGHGKGAKHVGTHIPRGGE